MEVVAEKSTSAQLKSIAKEIRGCRHELSRPEEHAGYIVELVERALAVPDAFSGLGCLRREIGRLKYNYPADWPTRALQAIARAFAPGFKPSSNFMEGGWFIGGWDDVEKIAVATEREADRKAKDETDACDVSQARAAADRQPLPAKAKGAVLNRGRGTLTVKDRTISLEPVEKHVLQRLVELGTAKGSDLKGQAERPDKVLKSLITKYNLGKYITLPGGPGKGGYSTTIELGD
jgi:hypothetical protein